MTSSTILKRRIAATLKALKGEPEASALLLSAAPTQYRNRDNLYPFRQNSDFYYLTGSLAPLASLLVCSNLKRPVLYAPKFDSTRLLWEGADPNLKSVAASIGADFIQGNNHYLEILKRLSGIGTLFHQNITSTTSALVAERISERRGFARYPLPERLASSDLIMQRLRLYKDKSEVDAIQRAARITNKALEATISFMGPGATERELAATIEYLFKIQGAEVAFNSIVATGSSAAVLHHTPGIKKLSRSDLVLFDIGAEFELYASDLTRVLPVSGKFSTLQLDLYSIVLSAQKAAISKVRSGVLIKTIYDAAASVIIEGLKSLKVLNGPTAKLLKNGAHKPYFPHGIGHSLGLDTHDIGNLRGNNSSRLESGMVFTIEPGIYFPRKIKNIPACGIRVEDTVLVTKSGCRILTEGFPKEPDEIEAVF